MDVRQFAFLARQPSAALKPRDAFFGLPKRGLVLVTALVWLLPLYGVPQDAAMHTALATALASIILTGLSSARAHHLRRRVGRDPDAHRKHLSGAGR